jgi:Tol biopolymer transport system component
MFTYHAGNNNAQLWIMDRDGNNPKKFYSAPGQDAHDPTWSPDGKQILFALGKGESNKLYIIDFAGSEPRLINSTIDTRGRSDWSINDLIAFDMGSPFNHDVYVMNVDGTELHQFSRNNAQGASLSRWKVDCVYCLYQCGDQGSKFL